MTPTTHARGSPTPRSLSQVTRSDGKAPPLLCNYLTTPHMLVHCASLASCAIPGVFDAVELQAKGRDGGIEPYFKTGGWTWTDGGLQVRRRSHARTPHASLRPRLAAKPHTEPATIPA